MAARFSDEGQPYYQLAKRTPNGPRWTGEVRFIHDHLVDPIRWRGGKKIFTNSMSDLFFEKLSNEEIAAIFGVMAVCKQHIFQVLTKRPKRMQEWFEWARSLVMPQLLGYAYEALKDRPDDLTAFQIADQKMGGYTWPLPTVWMGVSTEDQAAADNRIPLLLKIPAVVRFISVEPLIGPITLRQWLGRDKINWVVLGCESGFGARPAEADWFRALIDECQTAGVAIFLKQATQSNFIVAGPGSRIKSGGVIENPYFMDAQLMEFPNEFKYQQAKELPQEVLHKNYSTGPQK